MLHPEKTQVIPRFQYNLLVQKMLYQLIINQVFLRCQVTTTLHPFCLKSSMQSFTKLRFMFFFELETVKNI